MEYSVNQNDSKIKMHKCRYPRCNIGYCVRVGKLCRALGIRPCARRTTSIRKCLIRLARTRKNAGSEVCSRLCNKVSLADTESCTVKNAARTSSRAVQPALHLAAQTSPTLTLCTADFCSQPLKKSIQSRQPAQAISANRVEQRSSRAVLSEKEHKRRD